MVWLVRPCEDNDKNHLFSGSYNQLCEWSGVRELVIQSIMNDDSSLCKNAIEALDSFVQRDPKFDDECLPMVVPMIIKVLNYPNNSVRSSVLSHIDICPLQVLLVLLEK